MKRKLSAAERRRREKEKILKISEAYNDELAKLVINWANAESWLVNVLAAILPVQHQKADVAFHAIASTRGRTEFVQRVALMYLRSSRDIRHLQKLLKGFRAVTKTRNSVCHAEYRPDKSGDAVSHIFFTTYTRSDFNGTNYFEVRKIDAGFINEVREARRKAVSLCGSFERFAIKQPSVLKRPRETPPQLVASRKTKSRRRRPDSGARR